MEEKDLQLLQEARKYVDSTGKWMLYFAILMTIGAAFMVLAGGLVMVSGIVLNSMTGDYGYHGKFPPAFTALMGLIYIIFGIVYIIPAVILFRCSKSAKNAVNNADNEQMVEFLKNNKSWWKFCGILTIVCICIYLLLIVGIVIASVTGVL